MLHAYVAGTFFASTAFLEALANELLSDAAMQNGGHLSESPRFLRRLNTLRGLSHEEDEQVLA